VRDDDDTWNAGQPMHPTDNVLAAYLDGRLVGDERPEVEAHLEQCAECRRAIADTAVVLDASDAGRGQRPPGALRSATRRNWRRSRITWAIGGAAVAASIAGITILRPTTRVPVDLESPTRRVAPSNERIRDLIAIAPASDAVNVDPRTTFIWRTVDGADRYSFRLLGEDGATIWSRDVADTTVVIPADVVLERGRSYFWRVDAMSAGILASTPARRFTAAP
jgi:hypothetical protein